ncbi:MAG: NAD(P)H-dependent oxidoreductase [Pseudomonadota bacterium]
MTIKLLFLAGSARDGSFNKKLARLGHKIADDKGIPSAFADLADYPMPLYNGDDEVASGPPENAKKLKALMALHDGILITSPEYNASIPPLLKNALDWVSRVKGNADTPLDVFRTRVFALGSASPGGMGGLRGLIAVRTVLEMGLGALVLPDQFAVPRAAKAFDDNGSLNDKEAEGRYTSLIDQLHNAARILHGPDA